MELHEERRNIGEADIEMLAVAVKDLQNLPWSCRRRVGSSVEADTGRAAAAIEDLLTMEVKYESR
jgi:hypothetical protein